MPRKPLKTRDRKPQVESWKLEYLKTGNLNLEGLPKGRADDVEWGFLAEFYSPKDRLPTWEMFRSEIMTDWIKKRPCSRPWGWYEQESPARYDSRDPDPRQKVAGGGEVCRYNFSPIYDWGIYRYWHFDENDPPLMESEAAYLKRLDLLTEREKHHLSKNPDLLMPVPLNEIGDFRPQIRI